MVPVIAPGPWRWERHGAWADGWMRLVDANGKDVLAAFGDYCADFGLRVSEADARLIALAPMLLDFVKACAEDHNYVHESAARALLAVLGGPA